MTITYNVDHKDLTATEFLCLAQRVWPGEYNLLHTQEALDKTINITAFDHRRLIGCVRVLTDGYFFSTIAEILVDPDYQKQGIGRQLMEFAWQVSPSSLFFGAQDGNSGFFEKLGFERGLTPFAKKKQRRT